MSDFELGLLTGLLVAVVLVSIAAVAVVVVCQTPKVSPTASAKKGLHGHR